MCLLEDRREFVLLELRRRVHWRDVGAAAPEDGEAAESPPLAVQRDAVGAECVDDPRHVEVAGHGEHGRAVLPDRVDHAERIGRVAEVGEVARQDGAVGFAEHGAEPLDRPKGHVDVTEADEPHRPRF